MKLEKVILWNIRQFVGKQEIEFSQDPDKKITLFRAPNTTGKTTLLNAVFWCLYGEFLTGFEDKGRLRSAEASSDEYGVEVRFEHRNQKYIAIRQGRGDPKGAVFQVLEESQGRTSTPHPQPDLLVNSILPKSLASFFFFAGEYLKQPMSGEYNALATDSIRAVLGFKLAQQTIADLKEIRKKKQRELQTLSAGTNLAGVSEKLAEKETFVENQSEQLISQRNLVNQLEEQKEEIYEKLRGFESTAKVQAKRDNIESQLSKAKASLDQARLAKQQLVEHLGPALFLIDTAKIATTFIDDAVTKKRIPSPFDKTFVQDVLQSKVCVCGRPIHAGSHEYQEVAKLLNSATDETLLKRALAVRGVSEHIIRNGNDAQRQIRMAMHQFSVNQEVVDNLEQELANISDKMRKHDQNNVRQDEAQLGRIESTLRDLVTNRQRTENNIADARREIENLKREFEQAQAASPQVANARLRLELLELMISYLEDELVTAEQRGLERITQVLNEVVGSATRQKYSAEVTSDYTLRLSKEEPGLGLVPVRVLSSGERRLLILCFMSALVAVCRERETDTRSVLLPGAVAPMMVDAPFGELDPEYQALAATTMTRLSDQLILLLSETHYTQKVQEAIGKHVGRQYLMIGYRRGEIDRASAVQITVDGRAYDQIIYGSDKDWTEVKLIRSAS